MNRLLLRLASYVLVGVAAIVSPKSAHADLDELLRCVPRQANMLMIINIDRLFDSQMAKDNGWKRKFRDAASDQPLVVPTNAQLVVLAAQIDPTTLDPMWEIALVDLKGTPPIERIARAEGGYVDSLAGVRAAWTPLDAYFIELSSRTLAVFYPANRQYAGRWVRAAKSDRVVSLSRYLKSVAKTADTADIIVAMDLEDALDPRRCRNRIENCQTLAGVKADKEAVARVLGQIDGLSMHVNVGKKAEGTIRLKFGRDATTLTEFAKPLLVEFLDDSGAGIDDIRDWKLSTSTKGHTITLKGELSTGALRRVFSLIELPAADTDVADADETRSSESGRAVAASRKHFKAVTALLDNLSKRTRNDTLGHGDAVWMKKFARKIERLPILNVDDDLMNYSAATAEHLRRAGPGSMSMR